MSTLHMERELAAAPERVFTFITQTENLLNWWGPEGTRIGEHNLDFSKPGHWSATMISPSGDAHRVAGTVLNVDPPKSVELTLCFVDETGALGPESIIRFDALPNDAGGTRLVLTQTGLKEEHIADMRDKGWASALARLETLLAKS